MGIPMEKREDFDYVSSISHVVAHQPTPIGFYKWLAILLQIWQSFSFPENN